MSLITYLDAILPTNIKDQLQNSSQTLHWQSSAGTDIGNVRPLNEDAFFVSNTERIWCVADGMGGLSRGDYASNAVVKALTDFTQRTSLKDNLIDLENRLQQVNQTCQTAFRGKRLGTTAALLFAFNQHCFFIWAGDSRIYRLRNNSLEQITQDHTVAQQNLQSHHPQTSQAHILTQAIGVHKNLALELQHADVQANDRFLLCSDGLYNSLDHASMTKLLAKGDTAAALQGLIEKALAEGGQDNITAIVVDAQDEVS